MLCPIMSRVGISYYYGKTILLWRDQKYALARWLGVKKTRRDSQSSRISENIEITLFYPMKKAQRGFFITVSTDESHQVQTDTGRRQTASRPCIPPPSTRPTFTTNSTCWSTGRVAPGAAFAFAVAILTYHPHSPVPSYSFFAFASPQRKVPVYSVHVGYDVFLPLE